MREREPTTKRIFLTGASSGIGLAIAKSLAARGDEVWATSRDPSHIPSLSRLHPVRLDLSDSDSIEEAFKTALLEAGHFDVAINNAGSGHFGPAENLSAEEKQHMTQSLIELLSADDFKMDIAESYTLDNFKEAFKANASGPVNGKIIFRM